MTQYDNENWKDADIALSEAGKYPNGSPCGITIQRTVWCSRCTVWDQYSSQKATKFKQEIKANGWKCIKGQWICPECITKEVE